MPTVENWSKPLEDALLKRLSDSAPTPKALEEIRRAAALLDGAPLSGELERQLAQKAEEVESRYRDAATRARESTVAFDIEGAVNVLSDFAGYKDADAIMAEGRKRAQALREAEADRAAAAHRRRVRIYAIVAAVAVAVLAFFLVRSSIIDKRVKGRIAELQAMADAGKLQEALSGVEALSGEGVRGDGYPALYAVTETVLESVAQSEGVEAAYAQYDALAEAAPGSVNAEDFHLFVDAALAKDDLDAAERWRLLELLAERGESVSPNTRGLVLSAYLATLPADEGWDIVEKEVESGNLSSSGDLAQDTLDAALAEASGERAWEIAQQAVSLGIIKKDSDAALAAYRRYLSSLPAGEVWPVVYAARRDGTVTVDDEMLLEAYANHIVTMDIEDTFAELPIFLSDGTLGSLPANTVRRVQALYLGRLAEALAAGQAPDMDAWIEQYGGVMEAIDADPDAALAFVYALNDAGFDPAALFPGGLPLDLAMATRTRALIDRLVNDADSDAVPSTESFLPVSMRELTDKTASIMPAFYSADISALVTNQQTSDDMYEVRLLTPYLFQIPESLRPATFSECGSLLCMQNVYLMTGSITSVGSSISNLPFSRTSILPIFSALDMVAVYDLGDSNVSVALSVTSHDPRSADNSWFEQHKREDIVNTAANRLGAFDEEALRASFEQVMENAGLLPLYTVLGAQNDPSQEADHDADQ